MTSGAKILLQEETLIEIDEQFTSKIEMFKTALKKKGPGIVFILLANLFEYFIIIIDNILSVNKTEKKYIFDKFYGHFMTLLLIIKTINDKIKNETIVITGDEMKSFASITQKIINILISGIFHILFVPSADNLNPVVMQNDNQSKYYIRLLLQLLGTTSDIFLQASISSLIFHKITTDYKLFIEADGVDVITVMFTKFVSIIDQESLSKNVQLLSDSLLQIFVYIRNRIETGFLKTWTSLLPTAFEFFNHIFDTVDILHRNLAYVIRILCNHFTLRESQLNGYTTMEEERKLVHCLDEWVKKLKHIIHYEKKEKKIQLKEWLAIMNEKNIIKYDE